MTHHRFTDLSAWKALVSHVNRMALPGNHLKHLVIQNNRFAEFSVKGGGILYDFSHQRVDREIMKQLFLLAEETKSIRHFNRMMAGEIVNKSENRPALHTLTRDFSGQPVIVDTHDVTKEIIRVRNEIKQFAAQIHSGEITGSTGKPFRHLVVIGIGGSYLGTEFVATALQGLADRGIDLHFLANVDIDCFGNIVTRIDPEATLWVVISKSYTTTETMANENQAKAYINGLGLKLEDHVVTVTSKGSPGDDPANPVLRSFHMFDFIGGRFSVTSAVGGVPLSLYMGYDRFEAFLKGAQEMDQHARSAPVNRNAPLIAALISIWNNNGLGYPAQAVIPYSAPLAKLPAHIQQLYMESNGKSVTEKNQSVDIPCGVLVFGEPGTNAQHSFFQLAHQGRPFPIDFIGVLHPHHQQYRNLSKGVTNHQELWANLIAQPQALAFGKSDPNNPARHFSGNRPSATLVIPDLSPENIGRLLAFYEAKTVFEAFLWHINPFDQFGVELGKTMAGGIRNEMAIKNKNPDHRFDDRDPIQSQYLNMLFSGQID